MWKAFSERCALRTCPYPIDNMHSNNKSFMEFMMHRALFLGLCLPLTHESPWPHCHLSRAPHAQDYVCDEVSYKQVHYSALRLRVT